MSDRHSGDRSEDALVRRIEDRAATVAVLGMGYVGLPLAAALVRAGYPTLGIDTDISRVQALDGGEPYIAHLTKLVRQLAGNDSFRATSDLRALGTADAVLICVPSPLDTNMIPDLGPIEKAAADVAEFSHPDQLVVLQSTTYPGTTREILLPALSAPGDSAAPLLAYSPERMDPGGSTEFETIPKLVAGLDERSLRVAVTLYESVFADVRPVAGLEVAEAAKLLENTFRAVNIALVNELKVALAPLGLDIWDVIDAAASKPFGFMAFYPGPGVGGHCIPVDPKYLSWQGHNQNTPCLLYTSDAADDYFWV